MTDTAHASQPEADLPPGSIDGIRAELGPLARQHADTGRRIAVLSVQAIAALTRAALPGAAFAGLDQAQYDSWLEPACYFDPHGNLIGRSECGAIAGPPGLTARIKRLDDAIRPYCLSLDHANETAWEPLMQTLGPGGLVYDVHALLPVDRVLALPRVPENTSP